MTNIQKPAREWWVPDGYQFESKRACQEAFIEHAVHFVEYSAFEQMRIDMEIADARCDEMRKERDELRDTPGGKRLYKIINERDRYRQALEGILKMSNKYGPTIEIARIALEAPDGE